MNSRIKGKVGEREFAALLRENGFDARRGQQFSGGPDSPDIVSRILVWLHIEVKRCERIDMRSWVAQAEADCGGKLWVIAFRWNHGPWLFAGRIDLLFGFLRAVLPPLTENFEQELQQILDVIANRVGKRTDATSPLILSPKGGEEGNQEFGNDVEVVPTAENKETKTNQPALLPDAATKTKENENK